LSKKKKTSKGKGKGKGKGKSKEPQDYAVRRVRLPGEGELLGIVIRLLGNDRAVVKCTDGISRTSRIPGRMRKRIWIRQDDVVIVTPWDFQDEKADIIWRYTPGQVKFLEERGYLTL
jgi:translation initiation factor 1A